MSRASRSGKPRNCKKLKGKRDRALLALLLACGLHRHGAVDLRIEHLEQREEHWAIVDLKGKAGQVRTVPVPGWVMEELRVWLNAAGIQEYDLCQIGCQSLISWACRWTAPKRSFTRQRCQGINPYSPQRRDEHCDPAKHKDRDDAEKVDLWTARLDFEKQVIEQWH